MYVSTRFATDHTKALLESIERGDIIDPIIGRVRHFYLIALAQQTYCESHIDGGDTQFNVHLISAASLSHPLNPRTGLTFVCRSKNNAALLGTK